MRLIARVSKVRARSTASIVVSVFFIHFRSTRASPTTPVQRPGPAGSGNCKPSAMDGSDAGNGLASFSIPHESPSGIVEPYYAAARDRLTAISGPRPQAINHAHKSQAG